MSSSTTTTKLHFVLVHGACHGAWCWYKLTTLLEAAGHTVTALDLAASGVDPRLATDLTSITEYFQPLTDFMAALSSDEKIVLVGHSFGGLAISKAMEDYSTKISLAVFVAAMMPGPLFDFATLYEKSNKRIYYAPNSYYTFDEKILENPSTILLTPTELETMYQHSPVQDWRLATTLVRPLKVFGLVDTIGNLLLTKAKYGSVKRVYVKSMDPWSSGPDVEELMLKLNPPDGFVEIDKSDHMVMISQPSELSVQLQAFAEQYSSTT